MVSLIQRDTFCGALVLVATVLCGACSEEPIVSTPEDSGTTTQKDAAKSGSDAGDTNNWVQGYNFTVEFHGSYADGKKLTIERDLYDIAGSKQVFSFGSTHYSFGEIGFAMTESLNPKVDGKDLPMDFQLNFGLVKGSSKNPVHVDKAGTYSFGCKAPEIRFDFMAENYRSTCAGLDGKFVITEWSNETGGEFRGTFEGRLSAYDDRPDKPNPCDADANKLVCKRPEVYADVKGQFGFTLPEKDG